MSFIPAVQHQINTRSREDVIRMSLVCLLKHVGRENATPIPKVVNYLKERGVLISKKKWQTTVLKASRHSDWFIGSNRHGVFLIDTQEDAMEMRDFYETRIRAEQNNLAYLRGTASRFWKI